MSDISQSNWSETDGNNNQAAPQGFPEGMFPSGLNDSARQVMGAITRFWRRINGTVKATTVGNDYTYSPGVAAAALTDGEVYCFRVLTTNTGPARLSVGVGGFQDIVKPTSGGTASLSPSDIIAGSFAQVAWDSLSAHFVLLNNPGLDARLNDLSLYVDAGGGNLDARITSQSALWTSELASLSVGVVASLQSTSSVIKTDLGSVSAVIKADIGSVSSVIKSDISSVSTVIKADISSVSSVLETRIQSLSATMSTILNTAVGGMVNRLRLPVAWGSFNGSTPSLSLFFGFNFLSVTRSAGVAGKYRVRFQQAVDLSRGLAVAGNGGVKNIYVTDAGFGASATSIKLEAFMPGSASQSDDGYVSFIAYAAGYT